MSVNGYYFDFFKNTKCAVLILKNSNISYANEYLLELFGYTLDEVLTLHPADLSPRFQVDGSVSVISADNKILEALKTGSNMFEWQHIKKDGTVFWSEVLLTSVKEGEEDTIFALIKNISKRKEYERDLKIALNEQTFLLNNIADFIYKINTDGELTYVSSSVVKITGYSKDEWLINHKSYLTNNKLNKKNSQNREVLFSNKKKNIKYNIEIFDKNKNKLILELLETYYDENGSKEIIGIAKDVTEKYQNEMILLKSQKMELISSLSLGLVHELNNNLAVILGNIDLLNIKLLKEELHTDENINNIKIATQKAKETLENLLSISNKQSNIFKKIDLNDLILNMFSMLRNSFSKSVDLNLSLPQEEAIVIGDLSQLEQMFLNILINSYQAILNKGNFKGIINLKLDKFKQASKDYWSIEVSDNGIGIPYNILHMIFDPFFSTKNNSNDLGLGLTSSRNIVEAHDGFIKVSSVENEGTIVKVFIPVCNEKVNVDKNYSNLEKHKSNVEKSILLIDDEPLVVITAKAILEEFGYNVLTSSNGDDGIVVYKKNIDRVELVILDMDMPNKSGKDVYYELKEINKDVKVIISSGYENDERIKDVLNNGVKDFIPKPYGISTFIGKINSVLLN